VELLRNLNGSVRLLDGCVGGSVGNGTLSISKDSAALRLSNELAMISICWDLVKFFKGWILGFVGRGGHAPEPKY
jgi:hypothetical protein